MEGRIHINVSAVDYDKTSKEIKTQLNLLEEMVHGENDYMVTDSEFAFGWHFFVVSISRELVHKLAEQLGTNFNKLKGKSMEKKFLSWLTNKLEQSGIPRFKLAIKEEMESGKYGIF